MEDDPAVEWLLSSKDPSVRYLTLVDVLGEPRSSKVVRAAREEISQGPRVRALLKGQRRDGGFGVHPYSKWNGAHWRLVSLVELAIPPDHSRARRAVEGVLDWLTSERHALSIKILDGRVRRHASQEGNAIAVCCRLGMAGDQRVRRLVDSLLVSQWPDGGWNCDLRPEASHSSFYESITPLWGLSEYAKATGSEGATEAVDRAAEFFLDHGLFRSHSSGMTINPKWLKFHFPLYWHYDILHGLTMLARVGKSKDRRAGEALKILAKARGKDGLWRAGGYYWRPLGSEGSNIEVVDWGRRGPNEMITLNALRVFAAS